MEDYRKIWSSSVESTEIGSSNLWKRFEGTLYPLHSFVVPICLLVRTLFEYLISFARAFDLHFFCCIACHRVNDGVSSLFRCFFLLTTKYSGNERAISKFLAKIGWFPCALLWTSRDFSLLIEFIFSTCLRSDIAKRVVSWKPHGLLITTVLSVQLVQQFKIGSLSTIPKSKILLQFFIRSLSVFPVLTTAIFPDPTNSASLIINQSIIYHADLKYLPFFSLFTFHFTCFIGYEFSGIY